MLQINVGTNSYSLQNDDYYIRQLASGLDELVFDISIYDENYKYLVEETEILEGSNQTYLIKAIDAGLHNAKIKCQIDLDALQSTMIVGYNSGSNTVATIVGNVVPSDWQVIDRSLITISRTIALDAATPLEVIEACRDVFGVTFRFDNKAKTVTIINTKLYQPIGAFATYDLNLTELNYKGKSTDFITRLYAYGADGLSFADINDGKPYVDCNDYTDKVICGYWSDDRYTVKENLLADAQAKVNQLGIPTRAYDCSVLDLAKTNPEMYTFQNFELFNIVTLIDSTRNTSINHQIIEYWEYPFTPHKNRVILSTSPAKIQNQVKNLTTQIESPTSEFAQKQQAAIGNATNWITGSNGGYVIFHKNDQGQPDEILIMDTPDIATAQEVWRWNSGGLGHSANGYNGPYTTAITQDGAIVANFITTGVLNAANITVENLTANSITSGILKSTNGKTLFNLNTATLIAIGTVLGSFLNISISITNGRIEMRTDDNTLVASLYTTYSDNRVMSVLNSTQAVCETISATNSLITPKLSIANENFTNYVDITTSSGAYRVLGRQL